MHTSAAASVTAISGEASGSPADRASRPRMSMWRSCGLSGAGSPPTRPDQGCDVSGKPSRPHWSCADDPSIIPTRSHQRRHQPNPGPHRPARRPVALPEHGTDKLHLLAHRRVDPIEPGTPPRVGTSALRRPELADDKQIEPPIPRSLNHPSKETIVTTTTAHRRAPNSAAARTRSRRHHRGHRPRPCDHPARQPGGPVPGGRPAPRTARNTARSRGSRHRTGADPVPGRSGPVPRLTAVRGLGAGVARRFRRAGQEGEVSRKVLGLTVTADDRTGLPLGDPTAWV